MRPPVKTLLALLSLIAGAAHALTLPLAVTSSPINAAMSVSCSPSGVAPNGCFVDMTGTTATGVANPFTDIQYSCNFGDGAATWSTGSRAGTSSKNVGLGPVAAHIYESDGTNAIVCTITDGTNSVTLNASVTTVAPDTYYAGTATRCYSTAGTFTGCPSGATQITDATGDFDAAIAADLAQGRRLLFNRGETWNVSTPAIFNVAGPWTVGAYGTGAKPIILQTSNALNSIFAIGANGSNAYSDGRIMDLEVRGIVGAQSALTSIAGKGRFDNLTFLRTDISRSGGGWTFATSAAGLTGVWANLFIHDSTCTTLYSAVSGGGGVCVYVETTRTSIQGNALDNASGGEHVLRLMYNDRGIVSNNTLTRPNVAKSAITLRSPQWTLGSGPIPPQSYSQYVVVSDNAVTDVPGPGIVIGNYVDAGFEGKMRYYIFERNWVYAVNSVNCISIGASYTTARNNICDMSTASAGPAIDAAGAGGGAFAVTNQTIYNNTLYSTNAAAFTGIQTYAPATGTTIKNNLGYAPAASAITMVTAAQSGDAASNNSSNAQAATSPGFVGPTSTPAGFQISGSNYAVGGGAIVPVWSDFFLSTEPSPRDLGAVSH